MDELLSQLIQLQKRHTRQEKDRFLEFLKGELDDCGYLHQVLSFRLGSTRHLETSSAEPCELVLMAHYDTPTTLPIWFEWLNRLSGLTRGILSLLILLGLDALLGLLLNEPWVGVYRVALISSLLVPMLLVPSRHTMNDNTSGVYALLLLARAIAREDRLKGRVKLIFTDNEEKGLLGTLLLRLSWWKQGVPVAKRRIVSLDSIGLGDTAIVSYNCVRHLADEISELFERRGRKVKRLNKWLMPFSDVYFFGDAGAINVNMMRRALLPGGYYLENIHSARDTRLCRENVDEVVEVVCEYARAVCGTPPTNCSPGQTI